MRPDGDGTPSGYDGASAARDEIIDGLTNTLMVVEVPAEQAVIWTQPDDWELNGANLAALVKRTQVGEQFQVLHCNSGVSRLSMNDSQDSLRRMMQINDGNS